MEKSTQIYVNRASEPLVPASPNKAIIEQLLELNRALEKKALSLAEIREIPMTQAGILELIQLLFDTKKMQKDLFYRLQRIKAPSKTEVTLSSPIPEMKV